MRKKGMEWVLNFFGKIVVGVFFILIKEFLKPKLKPAVSEGVIKKYSRLEFALELKERVAQKQSHEKIGGWANDIFTDYLEHQKDNDFLPTLLNIYNMEWGPQYKISYERLNEIADEIISEEGYTENGNIDSNYY